MKRICGLIHEEPYRLFFPLGMLAGIWGVLMWPAFYAGWIPFYPLEAHSRIMIEGFMGAFVLGFLGTSFPRLTGNKPWFRGEFFGLLGLWTLSAASHGSGRVPAGDAAFAATLTLLFLGMAGRWMFGRRDTPPPGFVLAFAGIIGAGISAAMLAGGIGAIGREWARLWLFQGFLLLPLMGIGPYLLPRFFGMSSSHSFEDALTPPPGWWNRAGLAIACGLLIVVSFALEIYLNTIVGHLLRAMVVLGWFAWETPVFSRGKISSTPGNAVRFAVAGLTAGWVFAAMWPEARIGALHVFFVSGLGLATLAVATRVILGHAGRHDMLTGKIIWLRWMIGLLILAAATRMSADLFPAVRISHHIYAAWTWAIAGILWVAALARFFFRDEDAPPKPRGNCPRRQNRNGGDA